MAKEQPQRSHPEARGLVLLSACILCFISLVSFHANMASQNWLGLAGHGLGYFLTYLFGVGVYPLLGFAAWMGWTLLVKGKVESYRYKTFFFSLLVLSGMVLLNLLAEIGFPIPGALKHKLIVESIDFALPYPHHTTRYNLGGVPLYYLYKDMPTFNLERLFSNAGIAITFSLTGLVAFILLAEI